MELTNEDINKIQYPLWNPARNQVCDLLRNDL